MQCKSFRVRSSAIAEQRSTRPLFQSRFISQRGAGCYKPIVSRQFGHHHLDHNYCCQQTLYWWWFWRPPTIKLLFHSTDYWICLKKNIVRKLWKLLGLGLINFLSNDGSTRNSDLQRYQRNCGTLVRWTLATGPGVWINGSLQQNSSLILMIATTCHRSHFGLDHPRHHCGLLGLYKLHRCIKTLAEWKYLFQVQTPTNNLVFLKAHHGTMLCLW